MTPAAFDALLDQAQPSDRALHGYAQAHTGCPGRADVPGAGHGTGCPGLHGHDDDLPA